MYFKKNKVNIFKFDNINSESAVNFIKKLDLDLIVSVSSSVRLKSKILNLPAYGCINIHNSKLPKNRGIMPVFWSIYNFDSDPVSAITIHEMNESFDDGSILLQEEFLIDPQKTMEHYIKKTKIRGAELLVNLLNKYMKGKPDGFLNDKSQATYNKFPDEHHIKEFRKKGYKIK